MTQRNQRDEKSKGQKVYLVLSKDKRYYSLPRNLLLNNIFTNRTTFINLHKSIAESQSERIQIKEVRTTCSTADEMMRKQSVAQRQYEIYQSEQQRKKKKK